MAEYLSGSDDLDATTAATAYLLRFQSDTRISGNKKDVTELSLNCLCNIVRHCK